MTRISKKRLRVCSRPSKKSDFESERDRQMIDAIREMLGFAPLYFVVKSRRVVWGAWRNFTNVATAEFKLQLDARTVERAHAYAPGNAPGYSES